MSDATNTSGGGCDASSASSYGAAAVGSGETAAPLSANAGFSGGAQAGPSIGALETGHDSSRGADVGPCAAVGQATSSAGWPEGTEFLTLDLNENKDGVHRWLKLPDCDEFVGARRSKHTMVSYKGAIYIFGGDNGKQMLNDLIRYDPSDNSWGRAFSMGTLPAPRYHHTAVVYTSSMFVFGGYTGDLHSNSNLTNRNDLFEYKFSTGQWSEVQSEARRKPPARSGHGAAVFDGKMWVFGGFDGHTRLNDMWCIALSGGPTVRKWQQVIQNGDTPPPCHNFACTHKNDHLYLFSGQSGAKCTSSLFQFHFATGIWSRINTDHVLRASAPPPHWRYGHSIVVHNRELYVFGGAAESTHPPDMHAYDLESHTWRIVQPQTSRRPSSRLFHSSVVLGDYMYIFGGAIDNKARSSEIFRFQFSSYPRCTLHEDFGRLLEGRQFCDLRFLIGKDKVPIFAHIAIVAARSSYLRNKIKQCREHDPVPAAVAEEDMPDSPPGVLAGFKAGKEMNVLDVYIGDAEPFAFEMVLDYIYTDKIDPTQRGQEPGSNGVVLLMMAVYRLTLHFSLKRLESLALQYLENMICVKNVLVAVQQASRLGLNYVKEYCLKYIIKESNYNPIVMSKEFETVEQPLMVEIIRRRQVPFRPATENHFARVEGANLEDDMKAFLEDGVGAEFCDITLVSNELAIPVHKVILAARSAYFEAMFRSWMPETNTVRISLGDVVPPPQAFRSLLRYIYYGCTEMKPEDSLYLFAAPPFYGFTNNRLQALCKQNLETKIRTDNVLEIFEAADKIQAHEMKRHALNMIVQHFSKVAQHPKLQPASANISKHLLIEILQALALGVVPPTKPADAATVALAASSSASDVGADANTGAGVT